MKHTGLALGLALALTAFAANVSYTYDANGRLASATYPDGRAITYVYDPAGNLLSRTIGAAGAGAVITSVNTAGGGPGISRNAWIEIRGNHLVPADTPAAGVIWSPTPEFAGSQPPTQLAGVSVTVNGKPAFVRFYCSAATSKACASDQVNVLTPPDSTLGTVNIVVTSAAGISAPYPAIMKSTSPSTETTGSPVRPASIRATPRRPNPTK
ncbi:MAG: hypothetical protein NTY38_17830 [Acidobacteria bacterium]|nr:hypothetical protein [Acidobacteriota bacterium]